MDVDIYRSINEHPQVRGRPGGQSPAAIPFPDADLANLAAFRLHHRFNPALPYQGTDAADIAPQLSDNGLAVFLAPRTPS